VTTTGTRFIRCDLGGASFDGRRIADSVFENCRMGDIIGKPAIEGPYSIIDPIGISASEVEASGR